MSFLFYLLLIKLLRAKYMWINWVRLGNLNARATELTRCFIYCINSYFTTVLTVERVTKKKITQCRLTVWFKLDELSSQLKSLQIIIPTPANEVKQNKKIRYIILKQSITQMSCTIFLSPLKLRGKQFHCAKQSSYGQISYRRNNVILVNELHRIIYTAYYYH